MLCEVRVRLALRFGHQMANAKVVRSDPLVVEYTYSVVCLGFRVSVCEEPALSPSDEGPLGLLDTDKNSSNQVRTHITTDI